MKVFRVCIMVVAGWVWLQAASALANADPGVVLAWGDDTSGQVGTALSVTNAVAIAGGGFHSLALTADGAVVAWGSNSNGQTNVPPNLTNVVALAGGAYHSLALKANGTVVAWGAGSKGETNVPVWLTNATKIAAGFSHNLALTAAGRVVAWGLGSSGQTNVPANLTNAVDIACGQFHSLALTSNGTIFAWGDNSYGQTKVPAGLTNVIEVGAGFRHSLALEADGTVVGWGDSSYGQTNVPPDLTNAVQIAVGAYHNLALRADGTLTAWGYNSSGQTNVPEKAAQIAAIAAGFSHNLAITLQASFSTVPPTSVELAPGSSFSLQVGVVSGLPVSYQWYFNDEPLSTATGTDLEIDAFDLSKAGSYSMIVSNSYGTIRTSTVLRLTNSPVVLVDGVDAGGGTVTRTDSSRVTMSSDLPDGTIYYTLDGTTPDFRSILYGTSLVVLTNSATVRAIAYDSTYSSSAQSAPITVQLVPTYVVTANTAGGGTVALSPPPDVSGNRYMSNRVITLTATPAPGWLFLSWSGAGDLGTSNTTVLTVSGPINAQATFGTVLNFLTNGNGQILTQPAASAYAFGETVELEASPAPDSFFFGWAGAVHGSTNPVWLTVTNPGAAVTALFGALQTNQVSLTVLPDPGGAVSMDPPGGVFTNGAVVTLAAAANPGYVFSGWDGDASGASNPLSLLLDSSKIIRAHFSQGAGTNPPVIVQQPASRTVSPGGDTVLSVGVNGDAPFSYQWRFDSMPLQGATTGSLSLQKVQPAQAGWYDVVVSNRLGTATSSAASLALFGLELAVAQNQQVPLLTLDAAPGSAFDLEFSTDLVQTNWALLTTVQVLHQRIYYVDLSPTNTAARFYRAVPH